MNQNNLKTHLPQEILKYSINPIKYQNKIVSQIQIYQIKLNLAKNAEFYIGLLDKSNGVIEYQNVQITGEDYSKWGSDDSYVINLVLKKLGATLKI